MGNTPAQKRQKELRGKKKKKRKQPADPRVSAIMPKAGPVKIIRADGTVEFEKALPASKYLDKPYSKPRPRKAF
jgi:hypothetical protein